jgi:hypothetical protein
VAAGHKVPDRSDRIQIAPLVHPWEHPVFERMAAGIDVLSPTPTAEKNKGDLRDGLRPGTADP